VPNSDDSVTQQPCPVVIAIVDDDHRILRSLEDLLESANYAVHLFSSAAALLESGCVAEVDCLISDIDLPVIDGVELSRVVHAERPALPIILITGRPELLKGLPPTSPSHYRVFKKPFDGQELLTAVSEALQNPREPKL
jgi:FixJ family two-component response regulator